MVIKHADGKTTLYGHLTTASVKPGDKVDQGKKIGTVGSTGKSSGAHLHFNIQPKGVTVGGKSAQTLNPLDFLPKDGRDLANCIPGPKGYK